MEETYWFTLHNLYYGADNLVMQGTFEDIICIHLSFPFSLNVSAMQS